MKTLIAVVAAVVSLGLVAGDAFAFSCPKLVKSANEAIAKAEPQVTKASDDRQKTRNAGLIAVAKDLVKQAEADHSGGKHAEAEAKAHAATYLAQQVK